MTIFLNAKETKDDVSKELRAFPDHVAVREARLDRGWRREYMTLYMRDLENIEIGREEGRKEGRKEGREEGREEGRKKEREQMVENALLATKSVEQTAAILLLEEQEVRRIAEERGILVEDRAV